MKMKRIILALVCLAFAGSARAQTTIAVSASHIQGVNGTLLTSGSLCFQGTDANSNPIPFQISGGGAIVTTPYCTSITNGVITTFNVPNPASTTPVNIRYHIQVRQGSRVVADLPGAYLCNASGACTTPYTFNFDTCLSTSACLNNPLPLVTGPGGPPGATGPAGPTGATGPAGPGGAWSTVIDATAAAYAGGVKANWKEFYGTNSTITVTSGLATVTCTGCFTSTATNGGMTVVVTNAGGTIASDSNFVSSTSLFPAGTTILSVQSVNAATMSANATGSCSGATGLSCIFAFGSNDDSAWNAVDTAFQAINTCPSVIAPAGITNWDTVNKFNTAPVNCTQAVQSNTATLLNSGPTFKGQGPASTKIVLTPTFASNLASCGGTCMFDIPNMIVKDVGITGYGQGHAGGSQAAKIFGGGTGSYYENVSLAGFFGGDTNVNNFGAYLNYSSAMNFKLDGFGGTGSVCAAYCWVNGNSYFLNNFRTNFSCGNGFCFTFGAGYGTGANFLSGGTDYFCGPGATCYSENDNITYETSSAAHQIYQVSGGTLYLKGMAMLPTQPLTTGIYFSIANGAAFVQNSSILGGGSANAILVAASGAKIYDQCGNTISGPVTFSTALFVPCPNTAYTVTVPAIGATGTGACTTITTKTGNIFNGSLKCTGTTGASTIILTPGITAQNGWNCRNSQDITTVANTFVQTAISATTCTLTGTVNANDVVEFSLAQF
jgi:hypothetical protein